MFEPLRAGVYAIIMTVSAVTIVNTAPEPYQNKVVAIYEDSEDTKCFALKDSEQQICYKVEQPKVEEAISPQPEPTPIVKNYENGDVERLIREVFGSDANRALEIAFCESGLNPSAVGDTNLNPSSYGVFQIRAFVNRPPVEDLLDARKNIEFAHQMFEQQGNWSAWTCSRR